MTLEQVITTSLIQKKILQIEEQLLHEALTFHFYKTQLNQYVVNFEYSKDISGFTFIRNPQSRIFEIQRCIKTGTM